MHAARLYGGSTVYILYVHILLAIHFVCVHTSTQTSHKEHAVYLSVSLAR